MTLSFGTVVELDERILFAAGTISIGSMVEEIIKFEISIQFVGIFVHKNDFLEKVEYLPNH